ncbi:MAG: hypothetical protein DRI84_05545 [Bacteroidetes bacterium]|nr:MAG: hypothetical protein DRI84_05545 [Bacteroidota bacterium]
MNKHLANLKYMLIHKYNVAIECVKMGLYWHAITHDMSKVLPDEFFAYSEYFHGTGKNQNALDQSWVYHKNRNRHHWDFWIKDGGMAVPMPEKYVQQLIADWRGMGRQKGFDSAIDFYNKTKHRMVLHEETTELIHKYLFGAI